MDEPVDWIAHRYAYHAPKTEARIEAHQTIRREFAQLAELIDGLLPPGREKALAHTALQEASMWSNAAVALGEEGD